MADMNTNRLPLPLREGAFFFDNTMIEEFQCKRAGEYSQIRRRILAATRPSLTFGTGLHMALEHRYREYGIDLTGEDRPKCEQEQMTLLQEFFAKNPLPEDGPRDLNRAIELFVTRYNNHYPIEDFNIFHHQDKPMVEQPFALPFAGIELESGKLLPITECDSENPLILPVFFSGRIDLPTFWDGHIIIMDHKSSYFMDDRFWDSLRVSAQQFGYCWAFWKITGEKPRGFCVNAVGTRPPPMKPRDGIDAWWANNYQRCREFIMPGQLEEWEQNTFALLEEVVWCWHRGVFPQRKECCVGKYGKCQFYETCILPPEQRLEFLGSQIFQDNTWSPLD